MQAINPHNGQTIEEFSAMKDSEVLDILERSAKAFQNFRKTTILDRKALLKSLADTFEKNAEKYAEVIALEMGKPFEESVGEVKKAAKHARYCSDNIENFLKDDIIKTEYVKTSVEFYPIGPIFFITPFNFPFWLSIKGSVPAMTMGNTIVLKVASSCPRTGICLEEAFKEAGFTDEFLLVRTSQDQSELVIGNKNIKGVSFTGSSRGGATVASLAGKYQKKSIMELGGNDPLIVLDDGDVDLAVNIAIASRLRNCGQVCSSAKRYIIHESKYEEFIKKLGDKLSQQKIGNPLEKDTKVGPLASKKGLESVLDQLKTSVSQGGKLVYGGTKIGGDLKDGFYMKPAIVEVKEDNILFQEEVFGPVFSVISFEKDEDAIRIANNTQYGLAGVVVGKNTERAEALGKFIECGCLGINTAVASDSRLPSGGIKESGYGRECGVYGAREFVNVKSIMMK